PDREDDSADRREDVRLQPHQLVRRSPELERVRPQLGKAEGRLAAPGLAEEMPNDGLRVLLREVDDSRLLARLLVVLHVDGQDVIVAVEPLRLDAEGQVRSVAQAWVVLVGYPALEREAYRHDVGVRLDHQSLCPGPLAGGHEVVVKLVANRL